MRKGNIYIIGIASLAIASVVVFFARKNKKERMLEKLEKIADEGYEFAHDVLFPIQSSRLKKYRASLEGYQ